jgi:hypothetical protein
VINVFIAEEFKNTGDLEFDDDVYVDNLDKYG